MNSKQSVQDFRAARFISEHFKGRDILTRELTWQMIRDLMAAFLVSETGGERERVASLPRYACEGMMVQTMSGDYVKLDDVLLTGVEIEAQSQKEGG